jgi:hypothetical protein
MSIQQNFPAISPSLNLNFARSKTLDPRITFSRTSTATRVNEQGLVEVVSADIPRFDHKYENGVIKSLGLLVEESSSNLITYSEDFTQSIWDAPVSGKSRATRVTSTGIDDPSGGTTAATYRNGGTLSTELIWRAEGGTANVPYTMSVWIRRRTGTGQINLVVGDNIAVEVTNQVTTEWKRISVTATPTQTTIRAYILILGINDEIDIWGYQLEQKAFPTSYIPTSGGTATRNPDSVTMTGDNFSDWYNQSEGTVYADTRVVGVQTGRYDRLWAITNSDLNFQGIGLYIEGPGGSLVYVNTITSSTGTLEYGSRNTLSVPDISSSTTPELKSTLTYSQNYANTSFNGFIGSADTSVNLITADRLFIGQPQRFQGYSCMTVSQLTYYPRRLSNDNLQNLTK